MSRITATLWTLVLTLILTASSVLMIGPQIMFIAPLALLLGIVFAIRRSLLSLTFLGYPLTFALVSAYIGFKEMNAYTETRAFAISIAIGAAGVILIATGLWKTFSGKAPRQALQPPAGSGNRHQS